MALGHRASDTEGLGPSGPGWAGILRAGIPTPASPAPLGIAGPVCPGCGEQDEPRVAEGDSPASMEALWLKTSLLRPLVFGMGIIFT